MNLRIRTLTLSWLPFFKAYWTSVLAISLELFKFFTRSTACWSWHTSQSPSLATIRNWVLFSTLKLSTSGILETPSVLRARSPRALVMANCPATLPLSMSPPYFLILSCSSTQLALWSIETRFALPSRERTALVSPRLATWTLFWFWSPLTKTRQQVEPLSLAPTSFNCSSALARVLSNALLTSFLFLCHSYSNNWFIQMVHLLGLLHRIRTLSCHRGRRECHRNQILGKWNYRLQCNLSKKRYTVLHGFANWEVFVLEIRILLHTFWTQVVQLWNSWLHFKCDYYYNRISTTKTNAFLTKE